MRVVARSIEAVGEVTVSERKSNAAGPGAVQAFISLEVAGEGGVEVAGVEVLALSLVESGEEGILGLGVRWAVVSLVRGSMSFLSSVMVRGLRPLTLGNWSLLASVIAVIFSLVPFVADSVFFLTSSIVAVGCV